MTLIQVMRTRFSRLEPDDSLADAAAVMTRANDWLLPVCSGSRLVGSLSLLDLVAYGQAERDGPADPKVADAMTRDPQHCGVDTSLEEARDLLCRSRQPAVPVTTASGDLVGVIDAFEVIDSLSVPQAFAGPEPDEVARVRGR